MKSQTLTAADVLSIYDVVVKDFAESDDPISPVGLKSMNLLESAVSRQHTGFQGEDKYEAPILNAATLAYGICCDHPFHNGNKRTALITMLCHLDRNDLTFVEGITQEELYNFMRDIAGHEFVNRPGMGDYSDEEVQEIARWLRRRTRRVEHGERIITCRELKGILGQYGIVLENLVGNHVDVVRYRTPFRIFGIGPKSPERRCSGWACCA
jgi:death-on-curing protein